MRVKGVMEKSTVDIFNSCNYTLLMINKNYHSNESIGFMTITAYRTMHAALRRKLKSSAVDLTPDQWGVLVLLWERNSATQDELAAALCVDKSTMSRTLSAMHDKGLITRETDPLNERKKKICTAEKSLSLRDQVFVMASEAMQRALAGVSREDAAVCMKVLAAIKHNLSDQHI